ncbi:hypothetical protein MSSAC_1002 [Methanosarcina siciliae C2J]|uniref:Uncharacterized protein n=1 Tax=Methanosarcina siciliae C2J TaxID=1434118 RepID=A0A0E3PLC4_9EURY|nr:hypothetical protein [Methanosarcina siciliae]AKB35592.1 hypothetical protein MSSAC_1002 [Methanosarcina siciliae C2J]
MGIQLEKMTLNDTIGKPSKFKATFKGYYKGQLASVTLEAETERDLSYIVPLIPGRELELEIKDPQATLDAFTMGENLVKEFPSENKRVQDEKFRAERKKRAEAKA